ncbi:MAG: CRISPR-associated protein Cas5 [Candidatus Nitrosopelagicus sp.]|nr:CRISPR-associated protein Cas5 [Candidatus Nitrosopelagicus sp.]
MSGSFAAFRDPSVTSNQTVYYIPSKSALVGILGAMIGIKRSDQLSDIYSEEYLDFFKQTSIGIQLESIPKKVVYFTNHRSLKAAKTKPFKTEVVENPRYTIYVDTEKKYFEKLSDVLAKNEFVYSPYFGHAYCPASTFDVREIDAKVTDSENEKTKCVVLDESETYDPTFMLKMTPIDDKGSLMIERHIHHFFNDEKFDGRVLKHWIPTNDSEYEIERDSTRKLSKFYKIGEYSVCMY